MSAAQICLGEPQAARPECAEARHDWSIDKGTRDSNNGAMIHTDACSHCGAVRIRRRSYLGISSPGPTGDGRDYTHYRHVLPPPAEVAYDDANGGPPTEADLDRMWDAMTPAEVADALQHNKAVMGL